VIQHFSELDLPTEGEWIVPGILPRNGLVVLASAPKTGKSVFANAIMRAIAGGTEFAGITWQGKMAVCWCAHEETREERGPMLAGLTEEDPYFISMPPSLPFLDDAECSYSVDRFGRYKSGTIPYVYREAEEKGIKVLVIDCLHAAVRYSDLADNQVARRIMSKLRDWSTTFDVATIVLHHLTKTAHRGFHPERFADSAQILAGAGCHFFLESEVLEDGRFKVTLHGSGRQPTPPARQVFIADSLFDYRFVEESAQRSRPKAVDRLADFLQEGWELTAEEIARKLGMNPKTVRNTLANLEQVVKVTTGERKPKYRWEA
jgi:hypothetical protein